MSLSPSPNPNNVGYEEDSDSEQKIIYVTEQQATEWTRHATQELIKLYDEKIDKFEKGIIKTKKNLYEQISSEMTKLNFFYAPTQCENKWKSLRRAYLTRFEKNPSLIYTRPKLFEKKVAEIVRKEKRYANFRRLPDLPDHCDNPEIFEIDLNQPPGFSKVEDDTDHESDKDVKRILMGDEIEPEKDEHSYSFLFKRKRESSTENNSQNLSGNPNTEVLFTEDVGKQLFEIRKIIKKQCTETCAANETVSRYLDKMNKQAEENLQIKKIEIEKQNEIIQQMKIQNSLIAKLIQKLV